MKFAAQPEDSGIKAEVEKAKQAAADSQMKLAAATEALHAFLHRLDELALERPTEDSMTFTAATLFFRAPRSALPEPEGSER